MPPPPWPASCAPTMNALKGRCSKPRRFRGATSRFAVPKRGCATICADCCIPSREGGDETSNGGSQASDDVPGHDAGGVFDFQLAHQQRELLLERRANRLPHILTEAPHLVFEGAKGLLPRLIEKLLLGVVRRTFGGGMAAHPLVHLGLQSGRKQRVVVQDVQELGGQVDLARAGSRKCVKRVRRQRRR